MLISLILASIVLKAETIEFKLKNENSKCKGLSQIVITQDKTVLYQLDVPMSGTAQVQLLTGNYQIDAFNNEGCAFQDLIQVSDLPNKLIEIKLEATPQKLIETVAQTNSPCAWNAYGCSGNLYPYSGDIALGKPKYYFTGKDEGKFKLKFIGDNFN